VFPGERPLNVTLVPDVVAEWPAPETVYEVAPALAFQWTVQLVVPHETDTPVGVAGGWVCGGGWLEGCVVGGCELGGAVVGAGLVVAHDRPERPDAAPAGPRATTW
jgi:hypothetical protein